MVLRKNQLSSGNLSMSKILIVEDEKIIAEDLSLTLSALGHNIIGITTTGESAIKIARIFHPDIILMDIMLDGEVDGVQAAEQIRVDYNIPVIYVTAYSDEKTRKKAAKTNPLGYINKPFDERELLDIIGKAYIKH